jgi:hypothetical protein
MGNPAKPMPMPCADFGNGMDSFFNHLEKYEYKSDFKNQ